MSQPSTDTAARPVGRPRCATREAAIVAATIELLAELGFAGLSVEAVAARAGVGKATIYRRWPNKEALVVDALASVTEPVEPLADGSVRDNLVRLLDALRHRVEATEPGKVLRSLVGASFTNDELRARYRDRMLLPRRRVLEDVLRAGVDDGTLRPDLDVDRAVDLLVGPVMYRLLLRPEDGPIPRRWIEQLVDEVLAGLAAR